jgi:hypothetical protein
MSGPDPNNEGRRGPPGKHDISVDDEDDSSRLDSDVVFVAALGHCDILDWSADPSKIQRSVAQSIHGLHPPPYAYLWHTNERYISLFLLLLPRQQQQQQ